MDEGAAFGFFPQLRPRRRLQDPIASADVPLQVLRGRLAGLLGAPADIGNIVRSPMPMEAFGSYDYEQPKQLPYTTEQFLKELPLAPTTPVGQLAGQAASFVPLNPAPLVRGAQKLGTAMGQTISDSVLAGKPILPSLLAEPQATMFMVEPNAPRLNLLETAPPETMTSLLQVKPQAPVSELGFYSAAEQAALNLQRNKGSGQAFLNDLLKAENVKKDELQWMGVDDFLKDKPNVTKQELQDFIANNRVEIQEVQLGTQPTRWEGNTLIVDNKPIGEIRDSGIGYVFMKPDGTYSELQSNRMFDAVEEVMNLTGLKNRPQTRETTPKFERYTLPGGENYREILLKMPEAWTYPEAEIQQFTKKMETFRELQNEFANLGNMDRAIEFGAKADDLQAYIKQLEKKPVTKLKEDYQSSHFDEPNILAHIRVNDRVDADGKKMLLIEEIQSDWHQAGREKGYKSKESLEKWYNQNKLDDDPSFADLNSEQRSVIERNRSAGMGGDNAVPDAPFKDTWYQLALKRALKYAADNGYERVGLTTGKQQAERFDLSKQVDHIDYRRSPDGTFELGIADINGDAVNLPKARYAAEELPSLVGKEVADKIVKGEGQSGGGRMTLRGLDLQVGGEGMKKYYDEIYPKFLDKYGKKWNAKVGETSINIGGGKPTQYADFDAYMKAKGGQQEPIRYIDITPEMKGAVSKGQPLFAAAPALPLGAQGLLGEPEKKKELSLLD